jgi:hypothetical protein
MVTEPNPSNLDPGSMNGQEGAPKVDRATKILRRVAVLGLSKALVHDR